MSLISNIRPFGAAQGAAQVSHQFQKDAGFDAVLARISGGGTQTSPGLTGGILNVNLAAFGIDSGDGSQGDPLLDLIDRLFENMQTARDASLSGIGAESSIHNVFPFSTEFQSVFGTGGPLFDFIDMVTAKMGLSADKNLVLQNIAINNKDATRSQESIEKIARELNEAGIGTFIPA